MCIEWTRRYIDDHGKAPQLHTDKPGFQKKTDSPGNLIPPTALTRG
jgi:hypothetical protein